MWCFFSFHVLLVFCEQEDIHSVREAKDALNQLDVYRKNNDDITVGAVKAFHEMTAELLAAEYKTELSRWVHPAPEEVKQRDAFVVEKFAVLAKLVSCACGYMCSKKFETKPFPSCCLPRLCCRSDNKHGLWICLCIFRFSDASLDNPILIASILSYPIPCTHSFCFFCFCLTMLIQWLFVMHRFTFWTNCSSLAFLLSFVWVVDIPNRTMHSLSRQTCLGLKTVGQTITQTENKPILFFVLHCLLFIFVLVVFVSSCLVRWKEEDLGRWLGSWRFPWEIATQEPRTHQLSFCSQGLDYREGGLPQQEGDRGERPRCSCPLGCFGCVPS